MTKARSPRDLLKRVASRATARAAAGGVDVEDLLPLAATRDAAVGAELRALAADWPRRGRVEGSAARIVPIGRWAEHVCAALEGGPAAVSDLAQRPEQQALDVEDGFAQASVALAVLCAIRSEESVRAVLALGRHAACDLEARRALAVACAGALNELVALRDPVPLSDETAAEARAFLHALLPRPMSTAETAIACCALRGVGDESSLELLSRVPPLPRPWARVAADAARAIGWRLRARKGDAR